MITDRDVREQVVTTLQERGSEYDVEGIVREIIERFGLVNIDIIPPDEYWKIVETHERH